MGLLHLNTPMNDFHFRVHELLVSLKALTTGEVPQANIFETLSYGHDTGMARIHFIINIFMGSKKAQWL